MKPLNLPLELTRGDDAQVHFQFNSATGPFDLTGWVFVAEVRRRSDPALDPVAAFTVDEGPGVGEVRLLLEEEATMLLPTRGWWTLRAYHVASDLVQTWLAGSLRVDYQAESNPGANDFTVALLPDEVTLLVSNNVGPVGPKGDTGLQGTSGIGVPPGGITGQILAKASDDDYDTVWVDP